MAKIWYRANGFKAQIRREIGGGYRAGTPGTCDIAAVVVADRGLAARIGDRGEPSDAVVAGGGAVVAIGDVKGRCPRERGRRHAVQGIVAVLDDLPARVGLLRDVAGAVAHIDDRAAVGARPRCTQILSDSLRFRPTLALQFADFLLERRCR